MICNALPHSVSGLVQVSPISLSSVKVSSGSGSVFSGARQLDQVVDRALQTICRGDRLAGRRSVVGVGRVQCRLQSQAQAGQWSTKLVRGIGCDGSLTIHQISDACRCLVQCRCRSVNFGYTAGLRSHGEVAVAKPESGSRKGFQRAGKPACLPARELPDRREDHSFESDHRQPCDRDSGIDPFGGGGGAYDVSGPRPFRDRHGHSQQVDVRVTVNFVVRKRPSDQIVGVFGAPSADADDRLAAYSATSVPRRINSQFAGWMTVDEVGRYVDSRDVGSSFEPNVLVDEEVSRRGNCERYRKQAGGQGCRQHRQRDDALTHVPAARAQA